LSEGNVTWPTIHHQKYIATNSAYTIFFFFQAEDGIRDRNVTGVQTCALPIYADPSGLGQQLADGGAGDADLVGDLGLPQPVEVVRGGGAMEQMQVHRRPEHGAPPLPRVGPQCAAGRSRPILRPRPVSAVANGTIVPHFCHRGKRSVDRGEIPSGDGRMDRHARRGATGHEAAREKRHGMTTAVSAVLGVDVGTASTKGVLVALDGTILRSAVREHEVERPAPGHVEMDAEIWW